MVNASEPDNGRARLVELAEAQRVSLAALSRLIGRNPTYLQQFVRKGSPRKLEEQDRRKLAEFFGVAEAELGATGEKSSISDRIAPRLSTGWVDVPRLAVDASAGPGTVAAGEAAYDTFRFSERWLAEQGLKGAQLSAITVMGDSMEPTLRAGDEILVDTRKGPLRDGIYVLRLGDVLHVKRLQSGPPGRLHLLSQNMAYPPMEVAAEDVEVIGRVVWKGGRV
ncbi:S24 family peptidase [Paraurantiacibacter namhicola]|uniref:Putative HTH-type transcriptional regulator n=1 Tax=Paraurantiacibacter namhicola TaxID=645517 RepID=A0A1C7DA07_9SPHN|nr:LexA family transcriptional regulator [Paraurantiacibacter namhicola]ANU08329.1 putative HTH-type transcriptional regulator [Paraurantiacibacter namhicola]